MTNITRRKYSRYSDQVPIFFAEFNSENYKQGILHNICLDGMYFESNSLLQSKEEVNQMDAASITKDFISLQKQSFNSMFDAMILFQDQADKTSRLWTSQTGTNEKAQEIVDQWRTIMIKGRDDSRKLINDGFTRMEEYFGELGQKKTANK